MPQRQFTLSALCALGVTIIWAASGFGYFWPMWVCLALAFPLALRIAVRWARSQPPVGLRKLTLQGAVSGVLGGALVLIWAMSGAGFFWPVFPLLVLGGAYAVRALALAPSQGELAVRVDELTRTRRGALDVQAAELRRIERDLHDGAQSRLVALSMQLGRAEERLGDQPETAALVRRAREEATAAIAELRDLARGIAPPVLADRGLVAAVQAVADRSPAPVTVTAEVTDRPPPVVETAAYFVVAESLTNAAKHAPGSAVKVTLTQTSGDARDRGDRRRTGRSRRARRWLGRPAPAGRGLGRNAERHQPAGRRHDDPGGAAMRVVIVEDQALLREGIVALLQEHGIEVVAQAEDGPGLLRIVAGHKPDLAIVDVRLPPTFTDEGIRAALEARSRHPQLAVLVLSQYVEPVYTRELLSTGESGVGYLLKERVSEVRAFLDAIERVAGGGTALDREVVASLVRERDSHGGRLGARRAHQPRARDARADRPGPHERRDRARAGDHARRRREAHLEHLQQARPAGRRRRSSPRAGGAGVSAGDRGDRRLVAQLTATVASCSARRCIARSLPRRMIARTKGAASRSRSGACCQLYSNVIRVPPFGSSASL